MTKTLLGIFDEPATARRAMDELRASGLELKDISVISRTGEQNGAAGGEHLSAGEGATVGAVWGGLVGLAALLIPGVGPFIAGGVIFAALTGAATGAVVGGVAGALMHHAGLPEHEAQDYEKMVYSGSVLLAIKARDEDTEAVRHILAHAGARSIRDNQTDIAGSSARLQVAHEAAASQNAETDLAPGGATVRGAEAMPAITPPGAPTPKPAGLPGIYNMPSPITGDASDHYTASARREAANIGADTEETSATRQTDNRNRAILAEGWGRIGYVSDHEEKEGEAELRDSDIGKASERD